MSPSRRTSRLPGHPLAVLVGLVAAGLLALPTPSGAAGRGADGRFERRQSPHFLLLQDVDIDRYSGPQGSRAFERDVLEVLEDAYDRVSDLLNLRPRGRVEVRVYDPDRFDETFAGLFGFRAAGFYDGLIHVRGSERIDGRLVRTLHHEYAHAAISAAGGAAIFPGWLNEGLAEYLEHLSLGARYLSAGEAAALVAARDGGFWLPFSALSRPSFGHLGADAASLAYLQSFGLVVYLARRHGDRSLRDLCERALRSGNVESAFSRTYRRDLETVAREFRESLR